MMGELQKRLEQETVVDLDDIKQYLTKDNGLIIEIDEQKYLVPLKNVLQIVEEARKECPLNESFYIENRSGFGDDIAFTKSF